jgi:hypothetical protein
MHKGDSVAAHLTSHAPTSFPRTHIPVHVMCQRTAHGYVHACLYAFMRDSSTSSSSLYRRTLVCTYACTYVCMYTTLHICLCTNIHAYTSTQALTLSVIITSSLPQTSHRYFTTSVSPPPLADMRHVLPSCKRWPLDHQRARPPAYASRSSRCGSNKTHPHRSPKASVWCACGC